MKTSFSFKHPFAALLALFAARVAPRRAPATDFKFQFGADKAAPGYTLVSPTQTYSKDTGYGFEPGANVTAVAGAITVRAAVFVFSRRSRRQLSRHRHLGRSDGGRHHHGQSRVAPPHARTHSHGGGQIRDAHVHRQCPHPENFQRRRSQPRQPRNEPHHARGDFARLGRQAHVAVQRFASGGFGD